LLSGDSKEDICESVEIMIIRNIKGTAIPRMVIVENTFFLRRMAKVVLR
jgi:hypothetical protein